MLCNVEGGALLLLLLPLPQRNDVEGGVCEGGVACNASALCAAFTLTRLVALGALEACVDVECIEDGVLKAAAAAAAVVVVVVALVRVETEAGIKTAAGSPSPTRL